MAIRFIFDEGIGCNFVKGLALQGYNVEHVLDNFDPGTPDEEWLEYAGKNQLVLVTKDKGIRKRPNEKALLLKHGIIAFYLGGSEQSGHNLLLQLAKSFPKMEQYAKKYQKKGVAIAFRIRKGGGGDFSVIPLTNK
ncbi:MAG: DUF5615 family PIN-like protein [Promethearchaeota archaeon]